MKKLKKLILIPLIFACIALFAACDSQVSIIGTWELYAVKEVVNENEVSYTYPEEIGITSSFYLLTLNDDNTFIFDYEGIFGERKVADGTWSLEENTITLTPSSDDILHGNPTITIEDDSLVMWMSTEAYIIFHKR